MKQRDIELLEAELNSFDVEKRSTALDILQSHAENGNLALSPPKGIVNQHAHIFYSNNAYGYFPAKFAWLAKKEGLDLGGVLENLYAIAELTPKNNLPLIAGTEMNSPC